MFSKKVGLLVIILILFSLNTFAANLTEAYTWLNSQTPTEVYSAAWATLALSEVNGGSSFVQYLESQKDSQDCWPKGSCKSRETALTALALSKSGKNVDKSLDWLKAHQDISLSGEWLLQIKTENTGTCDVTYTTNNPVTKKINVDKGFITSDKCTTPSTFFNLGTCLDQNLLTTKASLEFDIKCSFSGDISSLYRDAGIYYLNDDVATGSQTKIKVNNGNFGSYEDTLITNWGLKELNDKVDSLIYLRKNFREDVKSNAFLYLVTQKPNYATELANLQKTDKSFGNVFETSIAILALDDGQHQTQIDQARQWLDLQQNRDHSWNNVLDTAVVLYSAYPKEGISLGEQRTVSTSEPEETECNEDDSCDPSENALSCPSDCKCGDNICDSAETSSSCPKDCEEAPIEDEDEETPEEPEDEEGSGSGFFGIIFSIIILGILAYFGYKKFGSSLTFKSKPRERPSFITPEKIESRKQMPKSEFKGPMNLLKPIAKVKSTRAEDELEKSLREARKILGK